MRNINSLITVLALSFASFSAVGCATPFNVTHHGGATGMSKYTAIALKFKTVNAEIC